MKSLLLPLLLFATFSLSTAQDVLLHEDANLGKVLTDSEGNTLYYFTLDAGSGFSACTAGCLNAWPVFHAANIAVGSGLDASDFSTFQRGDGAMQSAYKGWPLYYFANDGAPGDTNGEAVNNVWFVAKPDYSIMLMNNLLTGLDGVTYNGSYEEGEEMIQYFTDEAGRTLYTWVNDNFEQNNFTNEDFSNNAVWPVYEETLQRIPSTLDANDFSVIDVHGTAQLAYRGWPLYYFGQDMDRGETKGVSVPVPGIWPVGVADVASAPLVNVRTIRSLNEQSLFPNPANGPVNLSFELSKTARLEIRMSNLLGHERTLYPMDQYATGKHLLPINQDNQLLPGWYLLHLVDQYGAQSTLPFVVSQ